MATIIYILIYINVLTFLGLIIFRALRNRILSGKLK